VNIFYEKGPKVLARQHCSGQHRCKKRSNKNKKTLKNKRKNVIKIKKTSVDVIKNVTSS